jgi:uncharacterized damage-inducible protein DinB
MITPDYVQMMARYNQWQNRNLYEAADRLDDGARRQDRGAFFRSIHETLSHILWGDSAWMSRFDNWDIPAVGIAGSGTMIAGWAALKQARITADARIADWASRITARELAGDFNWYPMGKTTAMVHHLFNHQTHHRGQVHAMLTAAGVSPTATDLPFLSGDEAMKG